MRRRGLDLGPAGRLVALVLVLACVAGGAALYERQQTRKLEAELAERAELYKTSSWSDLNTLVLGGDTFGYDHRLETFLLVGTDNTGNETGTGEAYTGNMADFLLLMVLDHTDNTYGFLQIDRNTITEVWELDETGRMVTMRDIQICTSHFYGYDRAMSARNTVDAVGVYLGLLDRIDGYYIIHMDDIVRLNHSVGGVSLTFQEDLTMVDPAFEMGKTLQLTDAQAEAFVRARMGVDNDENQARMSRQRQYMEAFFAKVKELTAANPNFGSDLWNSLKDIAETDMIGNDFSRIAQKMLKGRDKGILRPEGESLVGDTFGDGSEYEEFYPDMDSLQAVMTELFSLVPVDEEELSYEVEFDEEDEEDDYEEEEEEPDEQG